MAARRKTVRRWKTSMYLDQDTKDEIEYIKENSTCSDHFIAVVRGMARKYAELLKLQIATELDGRKLVLQPSPVRDGDLPITLDLRL